MIDAPGPFTGSLELAGTRVGRGVQGPLPRWRQREAAADRLACLPYETVGELHESGLLHLLTSRRYRGGGVRQDFPLFVEAARIAASACPSTVWMLDVVGGHVATAARLSTAHQDEIFADGPRQVFARAVVQDGTFISIGEPYLHDKIDRTEPDVLRGLGAGQRRAARPGDGRDGPRDHAARLDGSRGRRQSFPGHRKAHPTATRPSRGRPFTSSRSPAAGTRG